MLTPRLLFALALDLPTAFAFGLDVGFEPCFAFALDEASPSLALGAGGRCTFVFALPLAVAFPLAILGAIARACVGSAEAADEVPHKRLATRRAAGSGGSGGHANEAPRASGAGRRTTARARGPGLPKHGASVAAGAARRARAEEQV